MADWHWQLQDAKQRFSEVVRQAETEGAQVVTRHGVEVVVVLEIGEYRRLRGQVSDFKDYLRHEAADLELAIERPNELSRLIDLSEAE